VDAQNSAYSSVDGVLFNKDRTVLIKYPEGKQGTSYTIPATVTTIGKHAFSGCENLANISIPPGVTSIESDAFSFCDSLTSISIPASVSSVGYFAFFECPLAPAVRSDIAKRFGKDAVGADISAAKEDNKKGPEMHVESLIGQVLTPENGKRYFTTNGRRIGGKNLCFFATLDGPFETMVGEVRFSDGKVQMGKYTGSDYDEIQKDFMSTVLDDMEDIKIMRSMSKPQPLP